MTHFYSTAFWKHRRHLQLLHEPFCQHCRERGQAVFARVVDHIKPHRGDWNKFKLGALQSLCDDCHNRDKRVLELRGYKLDVGSDGWPTDPNHPANKD
jgi:5-methylcytosine-specific restriction endonuclease McrA